MPRRKTAHSHQDEIEHIREDLDSLKSNVIALTKTVQHDVTDAASSKIDDARHRGREAMDHIERDVKARPMQSIATAFGAGVALSMLMRRR